MKNLQPIQQLFQPSKCSEERNKYSNEQEVLESPNWQEADQLVAESKSSV